MPDSRLPKYILYWAPTAAYRSRGRPRITWQKCVLEDAAEFSGKPGIVFEEVKELAGDRKHRREMIRHKREFIGAGHSND